MLSPAPDEQHAGGADDRPTVGSLFAGIGGIDIGLERVGFRTAWFCECDKFCQQVLAKHWPSVPCYDDVRELGEGTPRVDVLAGGFPCQPISNAGKRLAQADERWLWPEVARLIRILRPRAVLLENVAALLGRGFDDILGDLAASGYDAEWQCIRASDVGAPHRRERVFVVAHTDSPGPQGHRPERQLREVGEQEQVGGRGDDTSSPVADSAGVGLQEQGQPVFRFGTSPHGKAQAVEPLNGGVGYQWVIEPDVGRVAHGIPRRVDRLRSIGNAVVPQVAEVVGRRVMEVVRDART